MTTTTTTTVSEHPDYRINKTVRSNEYIGVTNFTVELNQPNGQPITVQVFHPEFEDWHGTPHYNGARVNWPGTESTRLAAPLAAALALAADEADQLNEAFAREHAASYFEHREPGSVTEAEFAERVGLILAELR